jgi:hypothetical protein
MSGNSLQGAGDVWSFTLFSTFVNMLTHLRKFVGVIVGNDLTTIIWIAVIAKAGKIDYVQHNLILIPLLLS